MLAAGAFLAPHPEHGDSEQNEQENRDMIKIEKVDGGWTVTDEATGRRGVAVTPASVAKRVKSLLELEATETVGSGDDQA